MSQASPGYDQDDDDDDQEEKSEILQLFSESVNINSKCCRV